MSAEYWEPYTFTVGQRVRVRVSPECRAEWGRSTHVLGHPREFDGETGTVDADPGDDLPEPTRRTHPYGVMFDRVVVVGDYGWAGGFFAAIELEPAARPPDERAGGGA